MTGVTVQTKTSIPMPDVIEWNSDASNAIGNEYIIMEHANGVQLHEKWPDMAGHQRVICIGNIFKKLKEMVNIDFPAYGSIYFADIPTGHRSIQMPEREFCIGPHCERRYWDCNETRYYERINPNHGPCKSGLSLWSDRMAYR